MMNLDIFNGNWKQTKGEIKKIWGKFTDDELDQVEGNLDKFIGKIQEKYGMEKEEARSKVNDLIKRIKE